MSTYSDQIQEEQQSVTRAYTRLDDLRAQARERLDAVRAAGSHGSPTQRTERDSFATMYEDRLMQLRAVEDRLVFGRLDTAAGERRYIGRIGLSDDRHEPILTDWRAEAARPFYEATPSHHGDIAMRRHITLQFRNVIGIEDEVLDIHADHVGRAQAAGTLTGEGALMATLASRRTGKMTDIVATIQAEQDRIIRGPLNRAVVVQGGPGTGKTAVALHRAAYLLYTHRRTLERSGVLVVGPSSTFLHYIDQVLPSLGETGVVSRTIGNLIPGVDTTETDTPKVAYLKGQRRMAHAIANAVAARQRVPRNLPTIRINGFSIPMLAVDFEQAIADAKRTRQPHNKARETFVRSMLSTLRVRYLEQLDYTPDSAELNDVMHQLRMNDRVRITLNLAWLPMTAHWLIDQLFSKSQQLRRFAPWLADEDVALLTRPAGSSLTISDVPLLDEAMELLGPDPKMAARQARIAAQRAEEERYASEALAQSGIDSGIVTSAMLLDSLNGNDPELTAQRAAADREWTYGHIVVDEAQELTDMDWRMLMRRCPSRSFTIVGDVAQTSALGGTRAWNRTMDRMFGPAHWDLNELTINYRNPQAVSHTASQFARNEGLYISTVNAVRDVPDAVHRHTAADETALFDQLCAVSDHAIAQFLGDDGTGRLAIILPDSMIDDACKRLWRHWEQSLTADTARRLREQSPWDAQVVICGAQDVKGLEYDAVIVAQPSRIEEEAPSRKVAAADLYVAMTRPTQQLSIVRTIHDEAQLPL